MLLTTLHSLWVKGWRFEDIYAMTGLPDKILSLGPSSKTDSLHLALWAMDRGLGDEVIIPKYTFFSTAKAISIADLSRIN